MALLGQEYLVSEFQPTSLTRSPQGGTRRGSRIRS